jgi:glycine betaine/proline transport system substrate-binding protein
MKFTKFVLGLGLAAVLSAFSLTAAQSQSVPESTDPIVLSKLDWTGQFVVTEVAAEILRRMGYNVEILQTTQVPMIQAMKEGQITASLENWYQALAPQYDAATEAGELVKLGPTGVEGSEGWYYPAYVAEKCPGLPEWSALKACAGIFATPETAPKGRLLDYPAEWNPDAQNWADAMGLDLVALPSGGEGSTAAELKSATLRQEPILLQWWEPTWVAAEFDLKRVMLDDGGNACAKATAAGIETRKVAGCPPLPQGLPYHQCLARADGQGGRNRGPEGGRRGPRLGEPERGDLEGLGRRRAPVMNVGGHPAAQPAGCPAAVWRRLASRPFLPRSRCQASRA